MPFATRVCRHYPGLTSSVVISTNEVKRNLTATPRPQGDTRAVSCAYGSRGRDPATPGGYDRLRGGGVGVTARPLNHRRIRDAISRLKTLCRNPVRQGDTLPRGGSRAGRPHVNSQDESVPGTWRSRDSGPAPPTFSIRKASTPGGLSPPPFFFPRQRVAGHDADMSKRASSFPSADGREAVAGGGLADASFHPFLPAEALTGPAPRRILTCSLGEW